MLTVACGDDGAPTDGGPTAFCATDEECDDGVFCNGIERCGPDNPSASAFGCVPASADPCLEGQTCDEESDRCTTICEIAADADEDGVDAMECGGNDCDDSDPTRYPGNTEVCDRESHDEDCDPTTFGVRDADRDGEIDARCCNEQDDGTLSCGADCDDLRNEVKPGGAEVCDGFDNDCDGMSDEGVLTEGFADLDGDQHGDPDAAAMACPGTPRFTDIDDDCDDDGPPIHGAQVEICDELDNDCDGLVDENTRPVSWYADTDGDGFGNAGGGTEIGCVPPDGYSTLPTDCDDERAGVNPATEERCDGLDNDCNGVADFRIGPNDFEDDDRDGYLDDGCPDLGDDCDDADPATYPGATEICDGRDNDCDGTVDEDPQPIDWYLDRDGDGFGEGESAAMNGCEPPDGHVPQGGDCDDSDPSRSPVAVDRCDGVDDDCDGTVDEAALLSAFYVDMDGDGAGGTEPVFACLDEAGVGAFPSDCDDADEDRYPGALEVCDGVDNDCDGITDEGDDSTLCDLPNASGTCSGSACTLDGCDSGFVDCDGEILTGCEADPTSDPANCGGCGNDCGDAANGTLACVDSSCALTCDAGFADCENGAADGCEASVMDDPRNCGACRNRCDAPNSVPTCTAGSCDLVCADGFEDCDGDPANGCEANLDGDPATCGSCGNACSGASDACVAGICRTAAFPSDGSDGAFEPTADTMLPAGVYHFTTVNVPAGVTVTSDGSGVLEIYASGDIVVDGTIDLSGGDGGDAPNRTDICGVGAGGGASGDPLGDGRDVADMVVCPGGGLGGDGGFGGPGTENPSHVAVCSLAQLGGRHGGGAGGSIAYRESCSTSGGGGGGYAGGAGGSNCPSETVAVPGGSGASVAGLSTGGAPATLVCGGGGGGETGTGAYAGVDGKDGRYDGILPRSGGGGGGSIGADAAADLAVSTTFRPGSGGGGGGSSPRSNGGAGGGGGGALRLASATQILVSGRLLAAGGRGGDAGAEAGGGGGGSGGVIYLAAPAVVTSGEVSASGGRGGIQGSDPETSDGGAGGLGRIRVSVVPERCALGGFFRPAAIGCSPTVPAVPERVYVDVYPF